MPEQNVIVEEQYVSSKVKPSTSTGLTLDDIPDDLVIDNEPKQKSSVEVED